MKALILALGISTLIIPTAAQASCLHISDFYTTCQDGYGNQYSIQTFGPNTFINGNNYYSRSPYSTGYPNRESRHYRHWGRSNYRNTSHHRHYSFSNPFKGKQSWQFSPYWQQPWKNNTYILLPPNAGWQRNVWQHPTYYNNQQNIYLQSQ